ncbi:MAG: glycoside hydrolase family 18 protein [archaeon]|nr:glycoside hydrolase family 18 protein [archaeon]
MVRDFKVIGYMPAWKTNKITKLRLDVLTHVIYSFAYPDDATLELVIPNLEKANDIIGMAHMNEKKVILSVGGWDDFGSSHKDFMLNAIESEETMDKLINNIVSAAYDLSFDGIDINWGNLGGDLSKQEGIKLFTNKLAKSLKEKNMTFSISVFGNSEGDNDILSYELVTCDKELLDLYDFVNIINCETREGVRQTNTNIKGDIDFSHSVQIPNDKAVMGLPFFVNVSLMAYQDDIKENRNANDLSLDIVTCGREIYCVADDEFINKVIWAHKNAVGLNVWDVTQDFTEADKSLITKIKSTLGI